MANKFLKGAASSDEESDEDDKTVVLSAKDKRSVPGFLATPHRLTQSETALRRWKRPFIIYKMGQKIAMGRPTIGYLPPAVCPLLRSNVA